ncbi:MAG: hypothetical protein M1820_001432 [Bogoriella megaspora]|nr:MAG: hypothetical protein M1820_001432 [Bogoriella megaspora]
MFDEDSTQIQLPLLGEGQWLQQCLTQWTLGMSRESGTGFSPTPFELPSPGRKSINNVYFAPKILQTIVKSTNGLLPYTSIHKD